jgi:hypothetical protein
MIEAADGSLKKINAKSGEIDVDVKLTNALKITDITTMREYQGFVFLLVKDTGLIVLNGLGKVIRTIEEKNLKAFNFLGEELYYIVHGELVFFDLFTTETRSVKLPAAGGLAVVSDEYLYLASGKAVEIYSFKP